MEYIYLGVPKRTLQKMGLIKPQTDGTEYPEDEREKVSQAVAEKLAKSDASIAALQLAPHGIWAYYNQKIAEIDRKKRQWNDLHNQFKDILGVGMREAVLEDYVGHGEDETHDTD